MSSSQAKAKVSLPAVLGGAVLGNAVLGGTVLGSPVGGGEPVTMGHLVAR